MTDWNASPRVAQASGMVSVQANCTPTEALDLIAGRAATTGQTVLAIAAAVITRQTRFAEAAHAGRLPIAAVVGFTVRPPA